MAIRDPLAGNLEQTGELDAQVLPKSSFDPVRYAEQLSVDARNDAAIRRKEKLQHDAENAALLSDDIQTKWDTDTYNYFAPKIQGIKERIIGTMAKQNGVLTPLQQMQFKQEQDRLHEEGVLNNAQFEHYKQNVGELEKDDALNPKYDSTVAKKLLATFNNPMAFPETAKDIRENYGGNVVKWRADHATDFQLPKSFSKDRYYSNQVKDEQPSSYTPLDEHGKPVQIQLKNGEYAYLQGKKLSDEQVNNLAERTLTGTGYADVKAKESAEQDVNKIFEISNGKVTNRADLPQSEMEHISRVRKFAGDLKGLSDEEIKRRLVKAQIAAEYTTKKSETPVPVQEGFAPKVAGDKKPVFTTDADIAYESAQQVQQNPNLSPTQAASMFQGGKAVVNPQTGIFHIETPVPPTAKYTTVPISQTNTFKDGAYRPNSNVGGEVAGTVMKDMVQWLDANGKSANPNTPGAKPYRQLMFNPVKVDPSNDVAVEEAVKLNNELHPDKTITAARYREAIKNGQTVGDNFIVNYDLTTELGRRDYNLAIGGAPIQKGLNEERKAEKSASSKPAVQTKNSTATSKTKTVPLSKIKSLVGSKGYEGYTEKELIDYYTSQGYHIQ